MTTTDLLFKKAENLAKREILLTVMEDLRIANNPDLHLKYMTMYDDLKKEGQELESKLNASSMAA